MYRVPRCALFRAGTLLTSKIDRTARREAMRDVGQDLQTGIWVYAAAGMIPISRAAFC